MLLQRIQGELDKAQEQDALPSVVVASAAENNCSVCRDACFLKARRNVFLWRVT